MDHLRLLDQGSRADGLEADKTWDYRNRPYECLSPLVCRRCTTLGNLRRHSDSSAPRANHTGHADHVVDDLHRTQRVLAGTLWTRYGVRYDEDRTGARPHSTELEKVDVVRSLWSILW